MSVNTHIVIVAGGSGSRFGASLPKQYCMLAGKPVLCHTIINLLKAAPHAHIVTVVSNDMVSYWQDLAETHSCPTGEIVTGGSTRWESVKHAIAHIYSTCQGNGDDKILVHDGARPIIDPATVTAVLRAIKPGTSAVPVTEVTNSLRLIDITDGTSHAVDRSLYRSVVTPQGFMLEDLAQAYNLPYTPTFTDDASVMAAAGMPHTTLIDSPASNIKITNPGDMALAQWYLTQTIQESVK